jgi:hypothetical protein
MLHIPIHQIIVSNMARHQNLEIFGEKCLFATTLYDKKLHLIESNDCDRHLINQEVIWLSSDCCALRVAGNSKDHQTGLPGNW